MNRANTLKTERDIPSRLVTPPPCQVEEVKKDSILSLSLLPPLVLVGCMVVFYRHMLHTFEQSLEADGPYVDPFKQVSWYPPLIFSVLYLSFLYVGKKFMNSREHPFELKHCIVTYNAYQVSFDRLLVFITTKMEVGFFLMQVPMLFMYFVVVYLESVVCVGSNS